MGFRESLTGKHLSCVFTELVLSTNSWVCLLANISVLNAQLNILQTPQAGKVVSWCLCGVKYIVRSNTPILTFWTTEIYCSSGQKKVLSQTCLCLLIFNYIWTLPWLMWHKALQVESGLIANFFFFPTGMVTVSFAHTPDMGMGSDCIVHTALFKKADAFCKSQF